MSKLYYMLPAKLRKPADIVKKKLLNFGFSKYCPVCKSHLRSFKPFGEVKLREGVKCPVCYSFERHRFFWSFLVAKTNLFDGKRKSFLHIAPEKGMSENFQKIPNLDYLSADIDSPLAMVKMDITNIQYGDNHFDVIYCSHVLEHIPNDRKALSELYRVLKSDGWILLSVPIKDGLEFTEEDITLDDPKEKLRRFGNVDHVRNYGKDFEERIRQSGFTVEKYYPIDILSKEQIVKCGMQNEPVFICKKCN